MTHLTGDVLDSFYQERQMAETVEPNQPHPDQKPNLPDKPVGGVKVPLANDPEE
jgi:hypothetical protein